MNLLSQFADDTSLYLMASDLNLHGVNETLEYARLNLGLTTNFDKTTVYRIGSLVGSSAKYYKQANFAWSEPPIYTLGVYVSTNLLEMCTLNILPIIEQINTTLDTWNSHNLTLMGRVLVVNTLIESKLTYRFWCNPIHFTGSL